MDEIKVGKAIEEELRKEEDLEISKAIKAGVGEEEESKADGKTIVVTVVVLIGLFALAMGGFKFYDSQITSAAVVDINELHEENIAGDLPEEEGYIYNGFSFILVDGLWWTDVNLRDKIVRIPLHFGPKELEEIKIKGQIDPGFNEGDNVYIAIDPNIQDQYYTLALSELSFNMAKGVNRYPVGSCTEENFACDNRTIISCENTQGLPVVELALAEETSIELQGTCIKVSGQEYGVVQAVDRLLYHWYGIMN